MAWTALGSNGVAVAGWRFSALKVARPAAQCEAELSRGAVLALTHEELRACGLSNMKVRSKSWKLGTQPMMFGADSRVPPVRNVPQPRGCKHSILPERGVGTDLVGAASGCKHDTF